MKRSSLLQSAVITVFVLIFAIHTAKALSPQHSDEAVKIKASALSYAASPIGKPLSHSNDQEFPEIKASTFTSLPSTLYIYTDQGILCIFEIQYEVNRFNNYEPPIPVALTRFFLLLFEVIVSPNAP